MAPVLPPEGLLLYRCEECPGMVSPALVLLLGRFCVPGEPRMGVVSVDLDWCLRVKLRLRLLISWMKPPDVFFLRDTPWPPRLNFCFFRGSTIAAAPCGTAGASLSWL